MRQSNPIDAHLPGVNPNMQTETVSRAIEWLDVAAAASEIGSGKRTIRAAIQSGELQACAINGRGDLRISREWLLAWMTKRSCRG